MSIEALPSIAARDVPTVTAAQMAEADRVASSELAVPLEALMENAAHQVAAVARALLGEVDGQLIAAIVGSGNNGGDALAALRHLLGWGAQVDAFVTAPAEKLRPLARRQHDVLAALGVPVQLTTDHDDSFLVHRLRSRHLILDGLLGYSAHDAPRSEIQRLIRLANASAPTPIVAVDLPSGLDPDSGAPLAAAQDAAIHAAVTVTLAMPKRGLLQEVARGHVGALVLADIGIPPKAYEAFGLDTHAVFVNGDLLRVAY